MITVTRLDGSLLVVNAELLVTVEPTPDTMIRLTTGERFLVRESVADVVDKVIAYQQAIRRPPGHAAGGDPPPSNIEKG
ncbi:MAG: flagellar FlbD family protein [Pseudomonadota bacterium]